MFLLYSPTSISNQPVNDYFEYFHSLAKQLAFMCLIFSLTCTKNALFRLYEVSDCKLLLNAQTVSRIHVPVGTNVISEGETLRGLYVIDEGVVEVSKSNCDDPADLETGNYFGIDQSLGAQLCHGITAKTATDCYLWFIENPILLRLKKLVGDVTEDSSSLDLSVEGSVEILNRKENRIRFNPTVKVVLMATKEEYRNWGLLHELWYTDNDYKRFKKENRDYLDSLTEFGNSS